MHLIPTILCGGAGSRLWPVSRELHPKPFIRLADGQSLLQKAFLRGAVLPDVHETLTVTNREFYFKTHDDLDEVNQQGLDNHFILEPCARNTAAAIAAAALYAKRHWGEEALLLVLAADHMITAQAAFAEAVAAARELAEQGKLVTFGITPDAPETGYGYIEADGNRVLRFVEKPSLDKARAYLESGRFLWNSGMFCFSVASLLREMAKHCPDILAAAADCIAHSRNATGEHHAQLQLDPKTFANIPANSIDYALMEKSQEVAVVPCNIGWSDIGSWTALSGLCAADGNGNRIEGEVLLHDSRDCYIQANSRLIGAVGVADLIIVDTADALLVAGKAHSQEVKQLYAQLKQLDHPTYKLHRTVNRPWGTYTVLEEGPRFKIKRIVVKPGASLSLQLHYHRSEHWVVVSGMAKVTSGGQELFVSTDQSTYIPAGQKHRLANPGLVDLVMIEVQSGEYLGENDIVRFDDVYGRSE